MQTKMVQDAAPSPKFANWRFWLWLAAALLAIVLSTVLFTAWLVRHALTTQHIRMTQAQADIIIAVAQFPRLALDTFQSSIFSDEPTQLLLDRKNTEKINWIRHFPEAADTGYLLFSGVDPVEKKSLVQLIRIADGYVIAQWNPNWLEIYNQTSNKKEAPKGDIKSLRALHPLLLDNGDIIFNTSASLVRLSSCEKKPVFVLDNIIHHSIELDQSGHGIWAPSVAEDGLLANPYLVNAVRDDSLAHLSTNGDMLENRSFSKILINNGLKTMLLGHFGTSNDIHDPIHLNQISVAKTDSQYWHKGDLLISARHLSTVFIYRPSTDKIVWHQTGPWLNQHSTEFVDDHRISIFDNNVVTTWPKGEEFFIKGDTNHFMVYDFKTKQVTQPFAALLSTARLLSVTEGRARLLPDGGLFIEETNNGRHLRFSVDHLLWSRINDYDKEHIGMVTWSRYLTADEVRVPLRSIVALHCQRN
jgi:hypothetical protein